MAIFGYDGTTWSYAKPTSSRRTANTRRTANDLGFGWTGEGWNYGGSARPTTTRPAITRSYRPPSTENTFQAPAQSRVLAPTVETEVNNSKLRAQWAAALEAIGRANVTDAERAKLGAQADFNSVLRDAFARSRATREDLSAAGLGYSPRFMGRAQRAIGQSAASAAGAIDRKFRDFLSSLAQRRVKAEIESAQELSDAEIDAQTEAGRRALAEMLQSGIYSTKDED